MIGGLADPSLFCPVSTNLVWGRHLLIVFKYDYDRLRSLPSGVLCAEFCAITSEGNRRRASSRRQAGVRGLQKRCLVGIGKIPHTRRHNVSRESWDFPRAESTVLELAHVYCTSHQSNFFAAAWYRAPCSAKQNLNFRSRLTTRAASTRMRLPPRPSNASLAFRSSLDHSRYKMLLLDLGAARTNRFAAVPSSLPAPTPHGSRT